MAFRSTFLLVTLLSLAVSQAYSQQVNGNVTLAGIVSCMNDSIATVRTYPLIPEATVDVVCGVAFLEKVIKSTNTNLAGIYSFSFNLADTLLLGVPELCHLKVTIPASLCAFDPSGGFLKLPILSMRSALGMVTQFVPGAPSYMQK